MVKVLIAGQSARGDDDDLPAGNIVPDNLDDSVTGDVGEVVVIQVLGEGQRLAGSGTVQAAPAAVQSA